jgi:hypothetical protein
MGRELSPEGKEKLSQLAKQRHAKGEFGGAKYGRLGGRPRGGSKKKQRITKAVAEAAEEEKNKNAIIEVFKDGIHPNQPISVRFKAATAWANIAFQQGKMEVAEQPSRAGSSFTRRADRRSSQAEALLWSNAGDPPAADCRSRN